MCSKIRHYIIILGFLFWLPCNALSEVAGQKIIVTYWPNHFEEIPYPIPGSLDANGGRVQNADLTEKLNKITILAYAFLHVNKTGHVYFDNPGVDLSKYDIATFCKTHPSSCPNVAAKFYLGNFDAFSKLDNKHHNLRKIISIGGELSQRGLNAAINHPQAFISSVSSVIKAYNLYGVDLDFEQESPLTNAQAEKLTQLIQLLRKKLGPDHYISIEIFADTRIIHSIDQENWVAISKAAYVSLMGYEFHSNPDPPFITANGSNLYHDPAEPNIKDFYHISDNQAIKYLTYLGVPANKIILGLPAFFHAYGEVGAKNNGLYQPYNPQKTPIYSAWKGRGSYIVMRSLLTKGFTSHVINLHGVISSVFAYNPNLQQWVSYENEKSAAAKAQYVEDNNLAGIMMWNIAMDVSPKNPDSLLSAIYSKLK